MPQFKLYWRRLTRNSQTWVGSCWVNWCYGHSAFITCATLATLASATTIAIIGHEWVADSIWLYFWRLQILNNNRVERKLKKNNNIKLVVSFSTNSFCYTLQPLPLWTRFSFYSCAWWLTKPVPNYHCYLAWSLFPCYKHIKYLSYFLLYPIKQEYFVLYSAILLEKGCNIDV